MNTVDLKVARIGNSRGVRLPAATLRRYRIGDVVVMRERADGILLQPVRAAAEKLSWEATAQAMKAALEDWSAWDATDADGLPALAWGEPRLSRVAERAAQYRTRADKGRRP